MWANSRPTQTENNRPPEAQLVRHATGALGAALRRKARHKGMKVAVFATAGKLAVLVYRLLEWGQNDVDEGQEAYEERHRERTFELRQANCQGARLRRPPKAPHSRSHPRTHVTGLRCFASGANNPQSTYPIYSRFNVGVNQTWSVTADGKTGPSEGEVMPEVPVGGFGPAAHTSERGVAVNRHSPLRQFLGLEKLSLRVTPRGYPTLRRSRPPWDWRCPRRHRCFGSFSRYRHLESSKCRLPPEGRPDPCPQRARSGCLSGLCRM